MSKCFGSLTQCKDENDVLVCANIDCGLPLEGFDLTKNQRFCRKCRTKNSVLRWRCRGCNGIITDTSSKPTRQFCDECKAKGIG